MLAFQTPAKAILDAAHTRPANPLKTWGKPYKIPVKSGPYRARISKAIFKSKPLGQQQAIVRRAKWRWALLRSAVDVGFERSVALIEMARRLPPDQLVGQVLLDPWLAQGVVTPRPIGRHRAAPQEACPGVLDAPPSPPAKCKRVSWGPVEVRSYVAPAKVVWVD